ncbi:interferon-induced transmembrane protein 1 [Myxocyprinus asiaticus]|uniref:interferon-induced transmembrane protein 1 n=1 Tax=Myxocyprinus asiaticus TaxID=70543 RepID=UPI002222E0AC|nr:interferon-induced transmembrane protein 1 [Myxocyprinus asiaticus]
METCTGMSMQDNRVFTQQPVLVTIPDHHFKDDIVLSTLNLHYGNPCCLGAVAMYNSVKARDSTFRGDFVAAWSYGARARRLNIASFCIIGFVVLISIITLIAQLTKPDKNES